MINLKEMKRPPRVGGYAEEVLTVHQVFDDKTQAKLLKVEATGEPAMLLDEQGNARFVRVRDDASPIRTPGDNLVFVNTRRKFFLRLPFAQSRSTLVGFYYQCLSMLTTKQKAV